MKKAKGRTALLISAYLLGITLVIGGVSGCASKEVTTGEQTTGCFEFAENLYTGPQLSPDGLGIAYVFDIGDDSITAYDTDTRKKKSMIFDYREYPIEADEFSSAVVEGADQLPDLSGFSTRVLIGGVSDEGKRVYDLYQMDSQIWLAYWAWGAPQSIDLLKRTGDTCEAA
ncbi:MAG: hypothetical protein FWD55_05530 [Propionibacteriaceae bacterium]|nr:hypothetical protein [Propionibacteriaceae bacterium]